MSGKWAFLERERPDLKLYVAEGSTVKVIREIYKYNVFVMFRSRTRGIRRARSGITRRVAPCRGVPRVEKRFLIFSSRPRSKRPVASPPRPFGLRYDWGSQVGLDRVEW